MVHLQDNDMIRLGTRKSPLALIQTEIVQRQLASRGIPTTIIPLSTQGDRDKTTPLSQMGGKGVFIKELEHALINNEIDIAVHSFKDITVNPDTQLELTGFLKPEAIEDAIVSLKDTYTLKTLPKQAIVGTGSLRRKALIQKKDPTSISSPYEATWRQD